MKGKYGGPLSIDDLYQAFYQDRDFYHRHGIKFARSVYLYFTPCNESGDPLVIYDQAGNPVDGFSSSGGYRSAAAAYDNLEPQAIVRPPAPFEL